MAAALRTALSVLLSSTLLTAALGLADGASAASIKSGPLQVTEDGRWAFTANARADSVSRAARGTRRTF